MTLKGNVNEGSWSVEVETSAAPGGGYHCRIRVTQTVPERTFSHDFTHYRTFEDETTAMLEGLREGMTWIELKRGHTFHV